MKIIFLGTGTSQGIPVIACHCNVCSSQNKYDKRLRTSALIKSNGLNILIDPGSDFRQQMLSSHTERIDYILITHEHKDHIGGLDDIRAINYAMHQSAQIYGLERTLSVVRKDYDYAFSEDKYPGVPELELHAIDKLTSFYCGNQEIIPIHVFHGQLPILGYRIGDLVYLTDVSKISVLEYDKLKNIKILVINALRHQPHHSHFNLEQALEFIEIVQPKQAYLTHISHYLGLHDVVQKNLLVLHPHVFLAYDGLEVEV